VGFENLVTRATRSASARQPGLFKQFAGLANEVGPHRSVQTRDRYTSRRLEGDDGADRGLDEGVGERVCKLVYGLPASAVGREDAANTGGYEGVDGRLDDGLEDAAGKVEASEEAGDSVLAGEPLRVAEHVYGPGVGAAGENDETLVAHMHDQVLVVQDHRVGLPAVPCAGVVNPEALLEGGSPCHLSGDEDGRVQEQCRSGLLHHLGPLGFKVVAAWRRQAQLGSGRENDLAIAPGFRVDQERQPPAAVPLEERFQPAVMVCMSVRDDESTQLSDRHLEDVEVAGKGGGVRPPS